MGKVIHWESCKELKFDQTNKWFMHEYESVLKNEIHKVLWDFEIQIYNRIPARKKTKQTDLVITKKKKEEFAV